MTFVKLPALPGFMHCNMCPSKPSVLPLDAVVHPGFGSAVLWRDGEWVYEMKDEDPVMECEVRAAGDEAHDWRLSVLAPLYETTYQRQGEGLWVLVERGLGFA